jgi:hypothetical protein
LTRLHRARVVLRQLPQLRDRGLQHSLAAGTRTGRDGVSETGLLYQDADETAPARDVTGCPRQDYCTRTRTRPQAAQGRHAARGKSGQLRVPCLLPRVHGGHVRALCRSDEGARQPAVRVHPSRPALRVARRGLWKRSVGSEGGKGGGGREGEGEGERDLRTKDGKGRTSRRSIARTSSAAAASTGSGSPPCAPTPAREARSAKPGKSPATSSA